MRFCPVSSTACNPVGCKCADEGTQRQWECVNSGVGHSAAKCEIFSDAKRKRPFGSKITNVRFFGRLSVFLRKISVVRAGGFLVLEPHFQLGRAGVPWERHFLFVALIAATAILMSCGSSASTTSTPTITVSCTPTDVIVLGTSQCTATVLNLSSTLVNWTVSGTGNGTITSGGLYTAPTTVPTNNVVTITATSQVQSTLTATQSLTLQQATAIAAVTCVNPATNLSASTVSSGNQLACTATASSGATVPVNWSVTNANKLGGNIGSVSAQGIYSAPLVPPPGQMVTITATSQALATETMSATATVVFGNAVLSGSYAFSLSGRLPNASNAFFARAGSFAAGGGTISGGTEDTNQGGTPNTVNNTANNTVPASPRNFTGSYSIFPDGRGTMQFCEDISSACPQGSSAVTAYFRIVVISPQQVQIIDFSSPSSASATTTAGGEIISQDPLVSPNSKNLSGTYSFNFAGVSTTAVEESVVGEFASDGFGNINAGGPGAPGEFDIDAAGSVPLAATTYSISSNGRGTMKLAGLTFSFYPVSASRVKFIEIDSPIPPVTTPDSILVGDAYKQQTSSTCGWGMNALNGPTVLEISGASSGVAIADLGSFTVAGTTGAFTGASLDENSGGTISSQVGTLSGTYTMDLCGRGTLAVGTHSYVFYIISLPSHAVLQEITSGVVAHGFLVPSVGGPFVDSSLTGSYAFRLGGTNAAGTAGQREDFLGQLTSSGKGTGLAGTLDLNDFGVTQTGVAITAGTYLPVPAGTLRGTMTLPIATAPSATTRNLVLYMVSPTLFYVLDVDPAPAGMAIGAINNQF